jgi:hypothetical protein
MKVGKSAETNGSSQLPQRFVAMCVEGWSSCNQPRNMLAPAMLAHSINLLLEESEPDEVAYILAGIAKEILAAPAGVGHA